MTKKDDTDIHQGVHGAYAPVDDSVGLSKGMKITGDVNFLEKARVRVNKLSVNVYKGATDAHKNISWLINKSFGGKQ